MKKTILVFIIIAFLIVSYAFLNTSGHLSAIKTFLKKTTNTTSLFDTIMETSNPTNIPTTEQTVEEYEASIPLESVQSPLYVRYGGNCFIICRTEDNARLCTEHIDHKAHFIEDINTAISRGETVNYTNTIWKSGSGVKFSFNGMSYDLTNRQCEKLIYDFEHPQPYLGDNSTSNNGARRQHREERREHNMRLSAGN